MRRIVSIVLALVCLCSLAPSQTNWNYIVSTVAGHYPMGDGGSATDALLGFPRSARLDAQGNLFIADTENHTVRKVAANGTITSMGYVLKPSDLAITPDGLYAGSTNSVWLMKPDGTAEKVAGRGTGGIGVPANEARIGTVGGLAVGPDGKVYLSDISYRKVLRFQPGGSIELVAGTGVGGFSGDGGPATEAQIRSPQGLTFDGAGNLYFAERSNNRIRKVSPDGTISTVAGSGEYGCPVPGPALEAELAAPIGVAAGPDGAIYFTNLGCGTLARITSDGQLEVLNAGSGFAGDGGPLSAAKFSSPYHVDVSASGVIHIADSENIRIRRVGADMTVATVAGKWQFGGDGGPASLALLAKPADVALDSVGRILIADSMNNRLRRVDAGGVIQTIAGTGESGQGGNGGPAAAAQLDSPGTVAADSSGTSYIGEYGLVRRVDAAGIIDVFAGTGTGGDVGDGGPATEAQIGEVAGLSVIADGSILISDTSNSRVRSVDAAGVIHRYAGTGQPGYGGDGGPAIVALLRNNTGVAAAADGGAYILDTRNRVVRRVAPDGTIATSAGNGDSGIPMDGEPATTQPLPYPDAIAVSPRNELYVASYDRIWKVSEAGIIRKIAGSGDGFRGDGGPALQASFTDIAGMTTDSDGNLYVADRGNHRIRKLSPPPVASAAAVNPTQNAIAGAAMPDGFQVLLADTEGNPIAGVPVYFTVTSGPIALDSQGVYSDDFGVASVGASTIGGSGTVTATGPGMDPITFEVTTVDDPSGLTNMPAIRRELGVVGAGLSNDPVLAVSPGGIVSIFGEAFATPDTFRALSGGDIVDNMLPTNMDGVCVMFGDQYGYMMHLLDQQMNVQVPNLTPGESVNVRVIRNCGQPSEFRSGIYPVEVLERAPEFFYWTHPAEGPKPVAAVNPVTGAYIGDPNLIDGVAMVPAKYGDVIDIYMTGLGAMDPVIAPGTVPASLAFTTVRPDVYFNNSKTASANVIYFGATQYAGVYLLRLQIPAGPNGFPARPDAVPEGYISILVQFIRQQRPPGTFRRLYLQSPITHLRIE
jgi:uncharacterized protein (TIGR03437 family)